MAVIAVPKTVTIFYINCKCKSETKQSPSHTGYVVFSPYS